MNVENGIIWIIEFREYLYFGDLGDIHHEDTVVVHVSSSREKAIEWCQKNLNYGAKGAPWWFTIYREGIDSDMFDVTLDIFSVDQSGNVLADILVPEEFI